VKPAYSVTIGSLRIDSTRFAGSPLPVDILVELRLNQVNTVRVTLGRPEQGNPAAGDPVTVALGQDGSPQTIFTGLVEGVKQDLRHLTVYGQSSLAALVGGRLNKLYEKQKAGEIVSDLAAQADVSTGSVENGIQFPVYALTEVETMLDHILSLARRNGYDCYADANDNLIFGPYGPRETHSLRYGVDILDMHVEQVNQSISGVEVYGESPSSLGQGAEAYSWLTKKDVKGMAGSQGATTLHLADPVLKNLDSTGSVAQAIFQRLAGQKSGRVEVLGAAGILLGDAIAVDNTPNGNLDGTYKVTAVRHRLNKQNGFVTTVYFAEV
jgi:hypothetical protein